MCLIKIFLRFHRTTEWTELRQSERDSEAKSNEMLKRASKKSKSWNVDKEQKNMVREQPKQK